MFPLSASPLTFVICTLVASSKVPSNLVPSLHTNHLHQRASTTSVSPAVTACLKTTDATLYTSSSANYSTVIKVHNINYDYHPGIVAQPISVDQLAAIIKCVAQDAGNTKIAPRSGGHSYVASSATGNVMLDLSMMTDLSLDETHATVTVGSGITLGPLAKAIGDKGYALPHGTCPTVGVGGHGLGGGYGFASRSWGWLVDRIISIQYVDPQGNIKTIDQHSQGTEADVWFAMRGAGANNFGVVSSFTYQMEKAPALTTNYVIVYPSNKDCANLLLALQDLGSKNPQDGGLPQAFAGEALFYGENSGDDGACNLNGQFLGSTSGFRAAAKLLSDNLKARGTTGKVTRESEFDNWVNALTDIMGDLLHPKIFEKYYAQSVVDDGAPKYTESSAKSIMTAVQDAVGIEGTGNSISFFLSGPISATNANPRYGSMSFVHRNALFVSQIYSYDYPGFDKPKAQQNVLTKINAITQSVRNAKPGATFLSYQNYVDPNLQHFGSQYYGSALDKLKKIKASVDPHTIFDYAQGLAHA